MSNSKKELIDMLNKALEMEHQAHIQYLAHAETIEGIHSEPVIARLKEIAEDEKGHAAKIRELIGDYLDGTPSMGLDETKEAEGATKVLQINLEDEKEAVKVYGDILKKARDEKENLPYSFWKIEHEVRHILMDEQEHIAEIRQLLAMDLDKVEAS